MDADGDFDAFVANGGKQRQANKVWLNDGNGAFSDSGQNLGDSASESVVLADLDGDGDLDAFVANSFSRGEGYNHVWLNDGEGNFNDGDQRLGYSTSESVAVGGADGDGDPDLFVANEGPNKLWLNGETAAIQSFAREGDRLVVEYFGTLETSETVDGEYVPVEADYSPYSKRIDFEEKSRFFRIR